MGTNEIQGTFYLVSDGFVFTGGTISGPFGPSLYPKTTTVINSVLDIPDAFKVSMPSAVDGVPVNLTNEFENARLVINSDLTMKNRIILYNGTLILNGDLTTVSTIGSYSGTGAYFGHLQVNGTQTGCAGYPIGQWSRLSGTGRMELASANSEVKIYGRLTPGTDEAPGTLTVKTGKVRFLAGAKMVMRVDLDADKADKLVCENGSWLISDTDQGAEIEIRISGKLKETRTYQLYEYDAGYKKNTFVPRIVRAPGCTALATFDETTGLLTVKPSGLMLILR